MTKWGVIPGMPRRFKICKSIDETNHINKQENYMITLIEEEKEFHKTFIKQTLS